MSSDLPMPDALTVIAAGGLLITWTGTIIGILAWLNRQFTVLREMVDRRVSYDIYEDRHNDLSERLRKLELWAAKKNGPD